MRGGVVSLGCGVVSFTWLAALGDCFGGEGAAYFVLRASTSNFLLSLEDIVHCNDAPTVVKRRHKANV